MDPIATVKQGQLRGKVLTNRKGEQFFGFLGVPYAKPPLGELRFKAPEPPANWNGIRDATEAGSCCYALQDDITAAGEWASVEKGSEDCLYLNVYTRELGPSSSKLKPVMFWIHGGGFVFGQGAPDLYGPNNLLCEDVVLVTINYRLGIFGFLSFDDESLNISGNAGMKDMVQALKWVKENIESFGGDPNNVTIFGESAGGASIHYLILSPMAKGLFHRAIIQSGSIFNCWARGLKSAPCLAKVLGINVSDEKQMLEKLLKMSSEEVYDIQKRIGDPIAANKQRPFAPIVEKSSSKVPVFLPREPIEMMLDGDFNHVPIMMGYLEVEGYTFDIFKKMNFILNFEIENDACVPYFLNLKPGTERHEAIKNKIIKSYSPDGKIVPNTLPYYLLSSDNMITYGVYLAAKIFARKSRQPVYYYRITLETELNLFKKVSSVTLPGATHCDEICYIFSNKFPVEIKPGSKEEHGIDVMVSIWTNFSKTGNPSKPKDDNLKTIQWKPATKDALHFLNIGDILSVGVSPDADRMMMWDSVFENTPYNVK